MEMWPLWLPLFFEVLLFVIFIFWLSGDSNKFWHWLKGSSVTYYIDESGFVRSTTKKLRTPADRIGTNMKPNNQGVIEINQGWFRLSSTIYGDFHIGPWKIAKASKGCNAQGGFGADWVDLVDCSSLPVENALHLINKYSSLQALMIENGNQHNRITELEKARTEPLAVLIALDTKMLHDKQRFRSPAAKEIHANIRFALRELFASGLTTDPNRSVAWMKNLEKPEAKVLR